MESSTLLFEVQVGTHLVLCDKHLIPVAVTYMFNIVQCFWSEKMLNSISVMLWLSSIWDPGGVFSCRNLFPGNGYSVCSWRVGNSMLWGSSGDK